MRFRQSSSRSSRRFSRVSVAAFVAVASAVGVAGCSASGSGGSGSQDKANTNYVAGTGLITTVPVKQRHTVVELSGKDLNGRTLDLSAFKGKVVVLNVWGSWCAPCRAEAKDFQSVFTTDQAKGVQFVGINTLDPQVKQAQLFVADHGLTYPSFYDPSGELLLKFPKGTLNASAIPTTIVLDRQGRVASRALMAMTSDQLTAMINPVIAEKP